MLRRSIGCSDRTDRPKRIILPLPSGPFGRGVFFYLLLALSSCAPKAPPPSPVPKAEISPMRFTIQVGAFSNVENAIRLTQSLESRGISAFYYRDASGLFKVRFGDFASRKEAVARAQSLMADGIISDYYIVSPESYPAAKAVSLDTTALRADLVQTAENFLGLPYQWGGTSPDEGFDCSGLVMAVYQLNGLNLPRCSRDQYASGRPVDRDTLRKGDLVFFSFLKQNEISHVGLYTGDDCFIHAPGQGKVIRRDSLSARAFATRFAGARTYLR